jgi:hypothetical protein
MKAQLNFDLDNQDDDIKQALNQLSDIVDPKLVNTNAEGPEIKNHKLL